MKNIVSLVTLFTLLLACGSAGTNQSGQAPEGRNQNIVPEQTFDQYWYQGKAEITSYKLEQARYGEIHPGTAVTVFVTEDFSKSKQVKLDNPQAAGQDAQKVLKLNALRNFNTGIYDYSTMESTFTPVSATGPGQTLKVTASIQEWCGQTFAQLNNTGNGYNAKLFSYFESEGDEEKNLPAVWLENELWNLIRTDPGKLPQGEIQAVPGVVFYRFKHITLKPLTAKAELNDKGSENVYTLEYPDLDRTLKIKFSKKSPYTISGWEETYKDGWGSNARKLTTKATLMTRLMEPYWSQNSLQDGALRRKLNLD